MFCVYCAFRCGFSLVAVFSNKTTRDCCTTWQFARAVILVNERGHSEITTHNEIDLPRLRC